VSDIIRSEMQKGGQHI